MDVSKESPAQSERRLRAVLRRASRDVLPGAWFFDEFPAARFQHEARTDALALVRGKHGWSQLVPVAEGDRPAESMRLWTFRFAPDELNSGFVGWLASTIKDRTGAGVIVVCGYSAEGGGVFDHWGCPAHVGDKVLALLDELSMPPERETLCLDGCLMNATSTADSGVIDEETLFHFRQQGEQVWADYRGGKLAAGFLVGTVRDAEFTFRYCQQEHNGKLDSGSSSCTLARLDDGRLQIREEFEWASQEGTGVNLITELPLT